MALCRPDLTVGTAFTERGILNAMGVTGPRNPSGGAQLPKARWARLSQWIVGSKQEAKLSDSPRPNVLAS